MLNEVSFEKPIRQDKFGVKHTDACSCSNFTGLNSNKWFHKCRELYAEWMQMQNPRWSIMEKPARLEAIIKTSPWCTTHPSALL